MRAVELFAGAGGLALGTSLAGFRHAAVLEWDKSACDTIRANQTCGVEHVKEWPLHETDVGEFDFRPYSGVELLAGGPPCQPFSIGGKHRGQNDRRNQFPQVVRAVREIQPKAVMIENVRGLLRPAFAKFFEYVLLQISFPEVIQKDGELWESHLSRLEKHQTKGSQKGLTYNVVFTCLNAADFGLPQKRHRVFIVGFRSDLKVPFSFPTPTHSKEALLFAKHGTGEYWERHAVPRAKRSGPTRAEVKKLGEIGNSLFGPLGKPWVTVRDAIADLPPPETAGNQGWSNHVLNPGAKSYPGHTGSPLDEPAKALKAGDHGVPGGENMLAEPGGGVRYFTIREAARLQSFPDKFVFPVSWSESMRQLGNAVPVGLAAVVAKAIQGKIK